MPCAEQIYERNKRSIKKLRKKSFWNCLHFWPYILCTTVADHVSVINSILLMNIYRQMYTSANFLRAEFFLIINQPLGLHKTWVLSSGKFLQSSSFLPAWSMSIIFTQEQIKLKNPKNLLKTKNQNSLIETKELVKLRQTRKTLIKTRYSWRIKYWNAILLWSGFQIFV